MKTLLILSFVVLTTCNPETSRGFAKLLDSLRYDDSIDMDEVRNSEDVYLKGLSHKDDILYSEVELLVEEEDLSGEPTDDDEMEDDDDSDIDQEDYPEELDLRDLGIVHGPIWQGMCGSCGWISGTQTLEARIAFVSENHIPYSIQNFMNCAGKPCVGIQPYSVNTQARKSEFIVPEDEIPYTKRACVKEGPGKSVCYAHCGKNHPDKFTNALHDQFVIIAGTRSAQSLPALIAALQSGPATTTFTRSKKPPGEKCKAGGAHANSIIGYNATDLIVRENYGKTWGPFKDGSWTTPKDSICGGALIKKAFYPHVMYDYDRANAYFTGVKAGVDEKGLELVDKNKYVITNGTTKNWGTAKNKCAFLGAVCKGVVAHSSGIFELVSDFGAGLSGPQRAFRKSQMVIYLRDEKTGNYIGVEKRKARKNTIELVVVRDKTKAAPFYNSYGRFILFNYPTYHMVENKVERIKGTIRDIALDYAKNSSAKWSLDNCMIYNEASNKSLDLIKSGDKSLMSLGSAAMNETAPSQRFRVGISGNWNIYSEQSGLPMRIIGKKNKSKRVFTGDDNNSQIFELRWQARHLMTLRGQSLKVQPGDAKEVTYGAFDIQQKEDVMRPTDCSLGMPPPTTPDEIATRRYLAPNPTNTELMMTEEKYGWTFEYADL